MKTLIAQLASWFGRAMGDGENPSSSRLIAVPSLLAVNILPTLVWVGLSVWEKKLIEFPGSVIGYIGSVNAALLVFVNRQKAQEQK